MVAVEEIMKNLKQEIKKQNIPFSRQCLATKYYERRISECRDKNEIVIAGSGNYGKQIYNMLFLEGVHSIRCFCDNDKEKQGKNINCLEILSIEEACNRYPYAYYLITPMFFENEILRQLVARGIPVNNIAIIINNYLGMEI